MRREHAEDGQPARRIEAGIGRRMPGIAARRPGPGTTRRGRPEGRPRRMSVVVTLVAEDGDQAQELDVEPDDRDHDAEGADQPYLRGAPV